MDRSSQKFATNTLFGELLLLASGLLLAAAVVRIAAAAVWIATAGLTSLLLAAAPAKSSPQQPSEHGERHHLGNLNLIIPQLKHF